MAIIYDSLSVAHIYTNNYRPQINVNPITLINSRIFNLQFAVSHYYDRFTGGAPGTPLYFIQSVKFESFYSNGDSVILVPTFNALYQSYNDWSATKSLDTLLLKNGFKYNYRIKATDRGLIPETSYSPDSGYYQCAWDFISDIIEDDIQVSNYSLFQNYPNPFNPSTNIKYAINNRQFVTLKVYDVLGNEVAVLVNEEKPAGNYEINFDAGKLSSAVYFYQLRAGSLVQTKKMIYLK
jgi:hypothetical protein